MLLLESKHVGINRLAVVPPMSTATSEAGPRRQVEVEVRCQPAGAVAGTLLAEDSAALPVVEVVRGPARVSMTALATAGMTDEPDKVSVKSTVLCLCRPCHLFTGRVYRQATERHAVTVLHGKMRAHISHRTGDGAGFAAVRSAGEGDGEGLGDGEGEGEGDGFGDGLGLGFGLGEGKGEGLGLGLGFGDGDGDGEGERAGEGDGEGDGEGEGMLA